MNDMPNSDFDTVWSEQREPIKRGPRVSMNELVFNRDLYGYTHEGHPFTGVAIERFPNGDIHLESEYLNGRQCGRQREWHPNGQLKEDGFLWNDSIHGEGVSWYETGELESWDWAEYGVPVESKTWDRCGRLLEHSRLASDDTFHAILKLCREQAAQGKVSEPWLFERPSPPVLPHETDASEEST